MQSRTANKVNEITDVINSVGSAWIEPTYSPAGNMTTMPQPNDPTQSFTATYDGWNRLVKLAAGSTTVSEYAYDGSKRRIVQKTYTAGSLTETRHMYYTASWQSIEERLGTSPDSAEAERRFVWGLRYIDDCVLRDRDTNSDGSLDERLYSQQDANWNVTAIIDETGAVQERYTYTAYGQPMFLTPILANEAASSFAWESLYCGYRYESATGVFHVRNRVYHPVMGTWVQRDPLGLRAGSDQSLYEPVHSRPLIFLDPLGKEYIWPNRPSGGTYCDRKVPECPQRYRKSRSIEERLSWYGCHCGGWNVETPEAPREPIDQIDVACRAHDRCYDKANPPCKGAKLVKTFPRPEFEYDPRPECEACDKEFCSTLRDADCSLWTDHQEREYCVAYRAAAMETVFRCEDRFGIVAKKAIE